MQYVVRVKHIVLNYISLTTGIYIFSCAKNIWIVSVSKFTIEKKLIYTEFVLGDKQDNKQNPYQSRQHSLLLYFDIYIA